MSSKEIRERARNNLKGKYKPMVLITLVYAAISIGCSFIPFIGLIGTAIIFGPLTLGYIICINKVYFGHDVKVSYLFNGFHYFGGALVFALLSSIFIGLWSLLFLIPGIIKSIEYDMGYYILADHAGMDGLDALNKSKELMKGHKMELFKLDLTFLGWFILGFLTCGILLLWVYPYYTMAKLEFYRNLINQ